MISPRALTIAAVAFVSATAGILSLAPDDSGGPKPARVITVWSHAGPGPESSVLRAQVAKFNRSRSGIRVDIAFPTADKEKNYNERVVAAAANHRLPDLVDIEDPFISGHVRRNKLAPLEQLLPPSLQADLLPGIGDRGISDGHLYAVGAYGSTVLLYANKARLDAAHVHYPSRPGQSWTAAEFDAALRTLAEHDKDGHVLDLGRSNGDGEWLTFAFSPMVWSAGGDLIDRHGEPTAVGAIDRREVARAMEHIQEWKPFVELTDTSSFTQGTTALSWNGQWQYPSFSKVLGGNLVVLPLPDFGAGSRTSSGTWSWGISRASGNKDAAAEFLAFLMEDEQLLETSRATGGIPGTTTALEKSTTYGPGGPLNLLTRQLDGLCGEEDLITSDCTGVTRPASPSYASVTKAFRKAFASIWAGEAPPESLHRAAKEIDAGIEAGNAAH
ncbi:sugar ABC transporter substrate-binding protein [Wenjunlia tyrosinilytica]|uniref:Sugar ABC transporter substrate-binding protein n=2 Tax=Wenjunlia tyrosinilytica TaxID=1544741 RepID=A0A917ZZA9_9ACTN|nr:sugar ABC transporter substrate-binding protein [Wenjunlia tyrosinilytica]